jgi:hypothetical protein
MIEQLLNTHIVSAITKCEDKELLSELRRYWISFNLVLKWVKEFFGYLDRYFIRIRGSPSLIEKAMEIFKVTVFDLIKKKVTNEILEEIKKNRKGAVIDKETLKDIISIYTKISEGKDKVNSYESDLEVFYLNDLKDYFALKAIEYEKIYRIEEFIKEASDCLKAEGDLIFHCMQIKTKDKMKDLFNNLILIKNVSVILRQERGLGHLLKTNSKKALRQLYDLYVEISNGMNYLIPTFKEQLKIEVSELYKEAARLKAKEIACKLEFVERLIEILRKYNEIVQDSFLYHRDVRQVYNVALGVVLNMDIPGVLLDYYCRLPYLTSYVLSLTSLMR